MPSVGEKLDTFDSIGRRKASNNKTLLICYREPTFKTKSLK